MPASFSTVNHKSFLSIRGVRTRGPRVRSDSFEMNKKKEGGGDLLKLLTWHYF